MKIELCAASVESIQLSQEFPFTSIELCQHLEIGGLTPSHGLFSYALEHSNKEIHILIRPRAGGFVYNEIEKLLILKEIESFLNYSVSGFVIGALKDNFELDTNFLEQLVKRFPNQNFTFHRAFDEIKNKELAIQQLIDLGFPRILTSGTNTQIEDNFDEIKKLIQFSKDKIEIVIGGGITQNNLSALISATNVRSIHFSGTILNQNSESSNFSLDQLIVSKDKIQAIFDAIKLSTILK